MTDSEMNPLSKQSADNYVQAVMAPETPNQIAVPVEIHAETPVSNFNILISQDKHKTSAKSRRSGDLNKRNLKDVCSSNF